MDGLDACSCEAWHVIDRATGTATVESAVLLRTQRPLPPQTLHLQLDLLSAAADCPAGSPPEALSEAELKLGCDLPLLEVLAAGPPLPSGYLEGARAKGNRLPGIKVTSGTRPLPNQTHAITHALEAVTAAAGRGGRTWSLVSTQLGRKGGPRWCALHLPTRC